MKKLVFIFLLGFCVPVFCQNTVVKDTSYTVQSTFVKEIKKYPFIKIALPKTDKRVLVAKDLVYKKIGERALHLDAFYFNSNKPQPAVILIHGGGWKSGDKSQMANMALEIASKGYSCFAIEYRLSLEAKFPSAIFDVKTAIQYVKANAKKYHVDATKVAVLGCSSGGQMAALIGATNKNPAFEEPDSNFKTTTSVQAIIDLDGVLAFKHPQSKESEVAAFWLGGNSGEKPEIWAMASALTHVNAQFPPILFINSPMERFHAGRDDLILKLNEFKTYSQVENMLNSPHSFWFFQPWFDQMIAYILPFLDKTFK